MLHDHDARLITSPEKGRGAGDRTRTYDPIITNDVLYQLSYTGPVTRPYSTAPRGGEELFFR